MGIDGKIKRTLKGTNRKVYRVLFLLLLLLSISSPSVGDQWHISTEILHTSTLQLPEDYQRILIVNNMVAQPNNVGHTIFAGNKSVGTTNIDASTFPRLFLFALTQTLDESNYFESISLLETSQNPTNSYLSPHFLTTTQVDSLCYNYQTDAVLSCNTLITYDTLGMFLTSDYEYCTYLVAYQSYALTIQSPTSDPISYQHTDTLYWESIDDSLTTSLAGLPDRQTALEDMSTYTGEKLAGLFLPSWEKVDRYIYDYQDTTFQRGLDHLRYQQWSSAIDAWTTLYSSTHKAMIKGYCANNIAVAYELQDDLDAAILWASRAVDAFSSARKSSALQDKTNLQYYLHQLQQRASSLSNPSLSGR